MGGTRGAIREGGGGGRYKGRGDNGGYFTTES